MNTADSGRPSHVTVRGSALALSIALLFLAAPTPSLVAQQSDTSDEIGSLGLPSGETIGLSSAVTDFYGPEPLADDRRLWSTRDGPTAAMDELGSALENLRDEGIAVRVFSDTSAVGSALVERARSIEDPRLRELVLSEAFVRTARALYDGFVDPDTIVDQRDLASDTTLGPRVLDRVRSGESPQAVLDDLRPDLPWYDLSVEALAELRKLRDEGGWPSVEAPEDDLLEAGDSSEVVESLRARFAAGVDDHERELAGRSSGPTYDEHLQAAVASFQQRHGIKVDSVVGPSTLEALNTPVDDRIMQLKLSLARMRWLPNDLGERAVFVNVAGFEMHVLEQGKSVMEMNVVVGRPDWPTTLFSDTLSHIVLNPYWHVPESIEETELLPKIRADRGYLAANNLQVVPADDNFGSPVDPSTVDFSSFEGYDLREAPGPENALGLMKFLFPNEYNIYLHDTPADHLFDVNQRAFSHGCVRLERPREFARYLFETATDRSASELDALIESGEWTRVDLTESIPVHLAYLTAWADEDGRMYFHPDIYDRNEAFEAIVQ